MKIGILTVALVCGVLFSGGLHAYTVNFNDQTVGEEPTNAASIRGASGAFVIVDANSTPASPFGTGNSLMGENIGEVNRGTNIIAYEGFDAIPIGTFSVDIFSVVGDGLNSSGKVQLGDDRAPKTGTIGGGQGAVVIEFTGTGLIRYQNLAGTRINFDQTFLTNTIQPLTINFDAVTASFSAFIGSTQLTVTVGETVSTVFEFRNNIAAHSNYSGGLNIIELYAGFSSNDTNDSRVFFDNMTVIPEPSSVALGFGLVVLACVALRRRLRS